MIIVETFERSAAPRAPPSPKAGLRAAMPWRPSPPLSHCPPAANLASGAASRQCWLASLWKNACAFAMMGLPTQGAVEPVKISRPAPSCGASSHSPVS